MARERSLASQSPLTGKKGLHFIDDVALMSDDVAQAHELFLRVSGLKPSVPKGWPRS